MDRDGYLAFPEFAAFIHLISSVKRGAPVPQMHEGLPPELGQAVQSLYYEHPAQIAASRSRSPSPLPSGLCTPATRAPSPVGTPTLDTGMSGFGMESSFSGPADFAADQSGFNMGGEDTFGSTFDETTKSKKKKSKAHKNKDRDMEFGSGFDEPSQMPSSWQPDMSPSRPSRAQFSLGEDSFSFPAAPAQEHLACQSQSSASQSRRHHDIGQLNNHFQAILEADRSYNRYLRTDMESKEAAAQKTHQDQGHLEGDTQREQQVIEQMLGQRQQLEAELARQRQLLADMHEERRGVDMEAISLRKDRDHFAEELAFLQRLLHEEEQHLAIVNNVNLTIERSYQALETHTGQLDHQRKELLGQVEMEKEAVKQEEKDNAELRHKLERMHRQLTGALTGQHHYGRKEEQFRQLQSGVAPDTNWQDEVSGRARLLQMGTSGPARAKFRSRECV